MQYTTKCLIIGSGGAGCTAGIYTGRANLKPILICGEPGGQLATTNEVENYPGFENIKGGVLMEKMLQQAKKCGTTVITDVLNKVNLSTRPFIAESASHKYIADSIIITTGAQAKWLGLKSETEYKGFGVSACAVCDGNFYRNKIVAVVGGGNTAVTEAIYLSAIAKKVYLVHRNKNFKAENILLEKIKNINNLEIMIDYTVEEIIGNQDALGKFVSGIKLKHTITNQLIDVNVDGVFIAIGHKPCVDLFAGQLELTEHGYIKTNPVTHQTSVKGVFAGGDVQDEFHKQAIIACGSGCICALEVEKFLSKVATQ